MENRKSRNPIAIGFQGTAQLEVNRAQKESNPCTRILPPNLATFPSPFSANPPPIRATSLKIPPSRNLRRVFKARAFSLPCLCGLSPTRASKSLPEQDGTVQRRWPRSQPSRSALSTLPTRRH